MKNAITGALAALLLAGPVWPAAANETTVFTATLGEKDAPGVELSTLQMRELVRSGGAIILDTRSRLEFDAGHIPDAVQIAGAPDAQIAQALKLTGNDKTRPLALYCNGPYCRASRVFAQRLIANGFTQVSRYQLGIPVWRALGGPVAIEASGVARIVKGDRTAVLIDARAVELFAKGSLPGAISAPADDVVSGKLKKIELPEDDFNRRIILFGADTGQARKLADFMSRRPWHNVSFFNGTFEEMQTIVKESAR